MSITKIQVSPQQIIAQALQSSSLFNRQASYPEFTRNANIVLLKRYLSKNKQGEVTENIDEMFRRVADNIAQADLLYNDNNVEEAIKTSDKFYNLMRNQYFMPNSPTLMNAGRDLQQLSGCFVLPVSDSLENIFEQVKKTAMIHKSGGGTGFGFSRLRPSGDIVGSTGGVASGPTSFVKAFDAATEAVKQGGTRRGANMAILHVTHPDIMEFIHSKRSGDQLLNFNISVAVTNDFMQQVSQDADYSLINPRSGAVVGKLNARQVFDDIVQLAWETGDPGLIFIDRINEEHPNKHLGDIESTNPCVSGDTWVHTSDGPRQVEELINKQFDAMVDGIPMQSTKEGFFYTGTKKIYKLITEHGYSINATENHLINVLSDEYLGQYSWRPLKEVKIGDRVRLHDHRIMSTWPGRYSYTDGYCVGHLYATGKRLIESNYEHSGAINTILSSTNTLLDTHNDIFIDIEKYSHDFYIGFLQSIFDQLAIITDKLDIVISLRYDDLESIQRMLARLGIVSNIQYYDYDRCLFIQKDNVFTYNEVIGFTNKQKQSSLNQLLNEYKFALEIENFTSPVESIIDMGYDMVYDVIIPGANSFDANGICVHNCGEMPLLPYESCNLGSINLARMTYIDEGKININFDLLDYVIKTAVHFLDNVIDVNNYPIPEIEYTTKQTRRIGLGVMGFADLLIQLGLPYNSEEALTVARDLMRYIRDAAHTHSGELAFARGSYPENCNSTYPYPIRNTSPTSIAPTGTISTIAGASSGIEPLFGLHYHRNVMDNTELIEYNYYLQEVATYENWDIKSIEQSLLNHGDLRDASIPNWAKKIFITSYQIEPQWHIRMQSAFQEFTDNAVSKTVNFPNHATIEDVRQVYLMAYDLKCKGVTVYRDGTKDGQVLTNINLVNHDWPATQYKLYAAQERPPEMSGVTKRIKTGHGTMYVTLNHDDQNNLFEVFGMLGKAGGCDAAMLEAITRLISLSLRSGVEANAIVRQLSGITCCPFLDNGHSIDSIPDAIARALHEFMPQESPDSNSVDRGAISLNGHNKSYNKCPECSSKVIMQEGCMYCYICHWSKC